ncbi:hypothetical protein PIB30_062287 [Stylosanthes scabra]|uniref:Uncharacterized protein n=1 Tax=Stylosanthes scabra TaxID=79078 RepID=A0ABU6TKV0_9FABA|nr:hypothetical protein [Stylosanthes scabra]
MRHWLCFFQGCAAPFQSGIDSGCASALPRGTIPSMQKEESQQLAKLQQQIDSPKSNETQIPPIARTLDRPQLLLIATFWQELGWWMINPKAKLIPSSGKINTKFFLLPEIIPCREKEIPFEQVAVRHVL